MPITARYHEALNSIPPPGGGCHPSLLGVANLGVIAGIDPERIHDDMRRSVPSGRRSVTDREISDAIKKALSDHKGGTYTPKPRPKPVVKDGKATLQKIISQAKISDEVDLWESSPIRLYDDPRHDTALFLNTLYRPDDSIWIGDRYQEGIMGDTIRTTTDWIKHFQSGGQASPHFVINPLSGKPAPTKSGDKETLRGDACVSRFQYCLVEFDNLNYEEQIKFWSAVKLPVVCLIHSGGKSIHGLLEVNKLAKVDTMGVWESEIKVRLYDRILKPLGVDGACSNAARLSRLPGHDRDGKMQKILWLSYEGEPLC
ncbi:MAG: hypothetical protein R6W88_08880 [Desulfobacterales bacterium]